MNKTIDYYNKNAEKYYEDTVNVDFTNLRNRFAKLLPENARIIDIGCGSGRDVKAFLDMGFHAEGLDASEELANIAKEKLGVEVLTCDMSSWIAQNPYDGIWCCASLLHLTDAEEQQFFNNLKHNLKPGGSLFLSVKEGVETGFDEKGRYTRNHTEAELKKAIEDAGCRVIEVIRTDDEMGREGFRWLNIFAGR